ncbi:hypothetical protein T11_6517 [Trichinella zimbabwensis]|uniref:Uncharacterized protein n=1 Tax=Trichinella zimbabwensis TaxID=268475 RepID=A0A0V1HZC9_9BILA|nr:hypothetical protein T11_6517 [Trichinella zimbabwensis]
MDNESEHGVLIQVPRKTFRMMRVCLYILVKSFLR